MIDSDIMDNGSDGMEVKDLLLHLVELVVRYCPLLDSWNVPH